MPLPFYFWQVPRVADVPAGVLLYLDTHRALYCLTWVPIALPVYVILAWRVSRTLLIL